MIEIIERNILDNTSGIICHQVNCFAMGKGLAKDIKEKYPIVYEEYTRIINQYRNNSRILLGEVLYVPIDESLVVANLFAQYKYRKYNDKTPVRYTDYSFLYSCLEDVKDFALRVNKDVHLPFEIGCGLGGGSWDIVFSIIGEIFNGIDINCYINKFKVVN